MDRAIEELINFLIEGFIVVGLSSLVILIPTIIIMKLIRKRRLRKEPERKHIRPKKVDPAYWYKTSGKSTRAKKIPEAKRVIEKGVTPVVKMPEPRVSSPLKGIPDETVAIRQAEETMALDISDIPGSSVAPVTERVDPIGIDQGFRNYELLEEIGEGGMGMVYRARQSGLERIVALKVLLPNLSRKEKFVERFMREARNAARLDHPNIVTIYEVGNEKGSYFFSMKYVEGRDLSAILKGGPMPLSNAISIIDQVARGLDHAHKKDIVHRDIKPSNIIIDNEGMAVITDFGIARAAWEEKLTTTGMAVGTMEYMSPEQFAGIGDIDYRSDIYSLGATFYRMVTGKSPFPGETTQKVIYKKMQDDPVPPTSSNPELPEWIDDMVFKAMAKETDGRFNSATDFVEALRNGG